MRQSRNGEKWRNHPENKGLLSRPRAGMSRTASTYTAFTYFNHGFQIISATVRPAGMKGMTCVL